MRLFNDHWELLHFLALLVETGDELLQFSLMLDVSAWPFNVMPLLLRRIQALVVRVLLVLVLTFTFDVQYLHSLLSLTLRTLLHIGSSGLLEQVEFLKQLGAVCQNKRFQMLYTKLQTYD